MVAGQALRAAEAFGRLLMAMRRLSVALALLTQSTVDGIAPITSAAMLAIRTGRQVVAWLRARLPIVARTVPVALAARAPCEIPARARARLVLWTTVAAQHTFAQTRFRSVVTPAARWIVATLRTRFIEFALRSAASQCGATL